jgi:hypothetical protein
MPIAISSCLALIAVAPLFGCMKEPRPAAGSVRTVAEVRAISLPGAPERNGKTRTIGPSSVTVGDGYVT